MEVTVCLNKHQPALTLKKGSQLFLTSFGYLPILFSLVISSLPTPVPAKPLPSKHKSAYLYVEMQSPQPGLAWPASGCPRLSSVHVKCRLSAHHLQSIASSASGNFPLSCPLLSQLILFSWDKGCPFSLLSPPVLFSRPMCGTQSSEHSLETCLQSAVTTPGLAGSPVLDTGFWTLSQESPVTCC